MRAYNVDAVRAGLLALAFLAVCGAAAAEVRHPDGVAVIIGNKDYRHKDVPPVAYAHRDAEAFKRYVLDVLGYAPGNVFDLRDADRAAMFKALGRRGGKMSDLWAVLARLPDGGDVVVYYSGHGVPGREGGKGYLLPVNVAPRAAQEDGYPLDLLYEKLGSLGKARSVRVFLDACFSGGSHAGFLVQGASPVAMSAAMPAEASDKVTVLTAAEGSQLASWDEEAKHGLFTHHLLDALYGKGDGKGVGNGDGKVTAAEAKAYLDAHMSSAAWLSHGREQQAVLLKAGEAEVVLASAEGGAFPARPVLDDSGSDDDEDGKGRTGGEGKVVSPPPDPAGVEKGLELDLPRKMLIQRSLVALGFEAGPSDGAFGPKTRGAVGAWQASKGYGETGYLTKGQAEALLAFGREAERRLKADDAAYARAKSSGTVEAFDVYLSSHPDGRHGAEAQRLRAEAELGKRVPPPGTKFRDCEGAWCPELVVVPSGSFLMGSPGSEEGRSSNEGPVHRVTIGRPFAVGVYEVTRGEFGRFVSATGRSMGNSCWTYESGEWEERSGRNWRNPGFRQTDGHPVVCVNWDDAKAYVGWLSDETGKAYRLLSEAEWEYVARGGTKTARYWGESGTDQCRYANGADEASGDFGWGKASCDDGYARTSPVGAFSANRWKLHDVLGNVWEWVEDCWNDSYHGAPEDGSAWESGNCGARVMRGGSWFNVPRILRSAFRNRNTAGSRGNYAVFRVARTFTP